MKIPFIAAIAFATLLPHIGKAQSVVRTINKLPDTGQNISYTNTFGEDNDYSINLQKFSVRVLNSFFLRLFMSIFCFDHGLLTLVTKNLYKILLHGSKIGHISDERSQLSVVLGDSLRQPLFWYVEVWMRKSLVIFLKELYLF
jgi:hypothetical protein